MHKARAFFFVCAGIFLLVLSYHLGARSAGAQAPGNPVVGFTGSLLCTANGDVYAAAAVTNPSPYGQWTQIGNVFSGGSPTPAQSISIGQLKAKYAPPATGR